MFSLPLNSKFFLAVFIISSEKSVPSISRHSGKEFNTFSGNEPAPVEQIPQTTKDGNEIKIKISIVEK